MAPFRLSRGHLFVWVVLAFASLEIRTGFPVRAIAYADMDDALFLRLAGSLGTGRWLGPFDNLTLVKGMFYPLFVLVSTAAGIPLKLAEHGVYLAAAAYVAHLAARSGRRGWFGTATFGALCFNPVFWDPELARVIREGLYVGLSLAVVGMLVGVTDVRRMGSRWTRLRHLALGAVLGVTAGGFWLTREEGIWILPAAATVVGCAAIVRIGELRAAPPRKRAAWFPAGYPLSAAFVGFLLVVGGVAALNLRNYGRAITVEVKSAPFERAYGALSRIEAEPWRRYVVFPRAARQLAYAASPAARELQPYLDGEVGETWRRTGCTDGHYPDCSEMLSSWFQWALREAVARAGHYTSLPEATRFYGTLAREVNDACDRGALPCGAPRASLAPPFRWHYLADAVPAAAALIHVLLRFGEAVPPLPSVGPPRRVDIFDDIAGPVSRGSPLVTEVIGWIDAPERPQVAFRSAYGQPSRADLAVVPADSDAGKPADAVRAEFRLSSDCPADQCEMVVSVPGRPDLVLTLEQMRRNARTEQLGVAVIVRFSAQTTAYAARAARGVLMARVARPIVAAYRIAAPVLLLTGTLGLLWATIRDRAAVLRSGLFLLGLASAVAVASRVALLAYVHVTAIASVNLLYASPATPFVILWGLAGTALLFHRTTDRRQAPGRGAPEPG